MGIRDFLLPNKRQLRDVTDVIGLTSPAAAPAPPPAPTAPTAAQNAAKLESERRERIAKGARRRGRAASNTTGRLGVQRQAPVLQQELLGL